MFAVLSAMPAGCRLTALCDLCHSASILDLPYELTANSADSNLYVSATASNNLFRRTNNNSCDAAVICFSGCEDDAVSGDLDESTDVKFKHSNADGKGCGVATAALCETLLGTAGLSYGQILASMRREISSRGLNQVPQLSATAPVDLSKPFSLFGTFSPVAGFVRSGAPAAAGVAAKPRQAPRAVYQQQIGSFSSGYPM
jgi:hypothetical protein